MIDVNGSNDTTEATICISIRSSEPLYMRKCMVTIWAATVENIQATIYVTTSQCDKGNIEGTLWETKLLKERRCRGGTDWNNNRHWTDTVSMVVCMPSIRFMKRHNVLNSYLFVVCSLKIVPLSRATYRNLYETWSWDEHYRRAKSCLYSHIHTTMYSYFVSICSAYIINTRLAQLPFAKWCHWSSTANALYEPRNQVTQMITTAECMSLCH